MPDPRSIVDVVLRDLRDRKGFDWWWADIDEDIQAEIVDELTAKVAAHLEES